jgi:large subunit ribosomal protein L18
MITKKNRKDATRKRHYRLRRTLRGSSDRPRLAVYRSVKHIYAQIINDDNSRTLVSASTIEPELREKLGGATGSNIEAAKLVGELISKRAKEKGISQVVFDRGGNLYHGRVAALAEAAREAGLEF